MTTKEKYDAINADKIIGELVCEILAGNDYSMLIYHTFDECVQRPSEHNKSDIPCGGD